MCIDVCLVLRDVCLVNVMIPYFQWTTISLGPLTLQVWGMWVAIGIAVSLYILYKRSGRVGLPAETLLDIALYFLLFGFIGARLGHVLFYEPAYFLANPWEIIAVWHGGMSSFGGFIGAAVGFWIVLKKKKIAKEKWLQIMDQLSFVALFGWLFARVGCFCIHDHLGMPCSGNCMLAMDGPDVPRYDMALFEILALAPLAIGFYLLRKRNIPTGWFTSVLMIYYGIVRFFLDFMRATDIESADVRLLGLTPGQYGAMVMVGIGVWVMQRRHFS